LTLNQFFLDHAVFTTKDITEFLSERGSDNRWTRKALLAHHQKQGRIHRVRRGLYVTVSRGTDSTNCSVDPYLLAAKMTGDAVLAYHTALEFHGKAYSAHRQFIYQSGHPSLPLVFRSYRFRGVLFPKVLRDKEQESFGVTLSERANVEIRVTSLERTLVDLLNRPKLGGGWEEIWRSLESVEFFDLDQVVEYTVLLGNAATVAKVGFYLEQHRESLMVNDAHLHALRKHRPKQPYYLERNSTGPARLTSKWNLIIPKAIIDRTWDKLL